MKKRVSLIGERDKRFYTVFFAVVIAVALVFTVYTRYNPFEIFIRSGAFWSFLWEDFIPPTMSRPYEILFGIGVTLALAVISTFIAMILAFFTAVFASTRTSPAPGLTKYIRAVMSVVRNIPTIIWAYILFSALGIGTGVACIALAISSWAFLTRAFVEVIDELPKDSLDALTASGSTFGQRVFHCVLPNCVPSLIEWVLYSIEVNIRSSTVVGMVGGGGIGLVLFMYIKAFNYRAAAGVIPIIVLMVIGIEWMMNAIRKSLGASLTLGGGTENASGRKETERLQEKAKRIPLKARGQDRVMAVFFAAWGVLCVLSLLLIDADWGKIFSRASGIGASFVRILLFDFTNFSDALTALADSVAMALLATIYSALLGVLFGGLMSNLVTKNKLVNALVSGFCSFVRAVPSVIWVLLVLVCIGFGPATGIVGLSIHSVAFFTKAFAQSFDDFGEDVVETLTATGANRVQIFFTGILPAVLSSVLAWFSLRVESNFSESTILGMVGAGGIGYVIFANIQNYRYGRAGVDILLVFLCAFGMEMLFTHLKKKYLIV